MILCVFLIAIVANIALFFFKSWAKPTFTVAILFCLLSTLYYQPQIFSALEAALYSIVSLIDGLIIALIYFSPISKEFDEQSVSVNNESVEALADKISKSVLKFSIAGILVALIGYGSITIFNTINEGKISPTVSGNNLESESEVIGARTLLKRFGSEITEEISSTLAGSLLYQVDEYRNNHAQWSDAEQIDKWLGLLESSLRVEKGDKREQYEHFDSYSGAIVGVKSAMMVIPAAEKWHLLNTDNLPKNEDAIQSQAVKYLFSNLNSDNNSIKDLLEKLEKSINTLEGDNKAARLRTLYKIQTAHIMSSGEPEKILSVLNKQLFNHRTSNEVIKIPNLVKIIGNEKATHWLKQAVVAENLILEPLKGTETYTLAKKLALELSGELKTPQWKLAQELNSVELYEKMYKKFSIPERDDYQLRSDFEKAFAYFFISHVVNNNVERSLDIIKNSFSKKDFKITKDIFYDLEKNGYSKQVWNVLDALLKDNPILPLWGSYFKVSASLDKTRHSAYHITLNLLFKSFIIWVF